MPADSRLSPLSAIIRFFQFACYKRLLQIDHILPITDAVGVQASLQNAQELCIHVHLCQRPNKPWTAVIIVYLCYMYPNTKCCRYIMCSNGSCVFERHQGKSCLTSKTPLCFATTARVNNFTTGRVAARGVGWRPAYECLVFKAYICFLKWIKILSAYKSKKMSVTAVFRLINVNHSEAFI